MSNQVGCMILTPHIHCGLTLMKYMLFLFSYRGGTNGSSPLIEAQYMPFAFIYCKIHLLGNSLMFLHWALFIILFTHYKQFKFINMNQKVQQLIDDGKITSMDVLEYAQQFMDGVDAYDDQQIHDYQDPYENEFEPEEHDDTMSAYPQDDRDEYPEYIIASTSYRLKETYVFEANEKGEIHDYAEYGGIAERFGDSTWMNYYGAVDRTFGENKYQFVRRIETGVKDVIHMLFKRID